MSRISRERLRAPAPPAFRSHARRRVEVEDLVELGSLDASERPFPLVVSPRTPDVDPAGWAAANRGRIDGLLLTHGAMLFRGFSLPTAGDFRRFAAAVSDELLESSERAAPRIEVTERVYTSTEYPPEYPIPLHHENAFAYKWPLKVLFYCQTPAVEGGATPIADDRRFLERLDADIRERFRRKQVMYVRNYGAGVDMPWQEVFQTRDRAEVEAYCRAGGLRCDWRGDRLRTVRVSPALRQHPATGQDLWFNHAHLFHVSNLEPRLRDALTSEFAEEDLPRNTYYGDGTPIDSSDLDRIRETYASVAVRFQWQREDVLLVDNMAIAHGREPFVGERKTLVILAECSLSRLPDAQGASGAAGQERPSVA